jgi:ribosome biogenesis GTPase
MGIEDDNLFEEYFSYEEKKSAKQHRKHIEATDRSKYKKTDQKMLVKQAAPVMREGLLRGRVLSIMSQGMIVSNDKKLFTCALKGILKKDKGAQKNLVAVGDFVLFEVIHDHEGVIVHVEERFSTLSRADNLLRRKEQLIAANIDQVLITVSVVHPPLKTFIVDRYIIATEKGNMKPIIVVNKVDLLEDINFPENERMFEKELLLSFIDAYRKAGITVLEVSSETGFGLDELKAAMKDKASVFSGQSGVGKSSLINSVIGSSLRVGDVVDKTKKGSHTTTMAQLLPLDFGGFCIDTPGIKSFGIWNLEKGEVEAYFPEIHQMGAGCKFPDCSHTHEKNCAVLEAVESQAISPLRFASYLYLLESLGQVHRPR